MRTTLTKEYRFEASHQLPNHDGKCARLHGHSYRVMVEVEGPVRPDDGSPQEGMIVDFGVLDDVWAVVGAPLDHQHLNDLPPFGGVVPTTAENIARYLLSAMREEASQGQAFGDATISAVRVWETAKCSAVARA